MVAWVAILVVRPWSSAALTDLGDGGCSRSPFSRTMKRLLTALFFGAACAATLSAQTVIAQWRFGEGDGGASNGAAVGATTTDAVGTNHLTRTSAATYTGTTPGAGSTLAIVADTSAMFSGTAITSVSSASSFFMEVWFKPTTLSGSQTLVYNGDGSFRGLGLYLDGSTLRLLAGGQFDNATTGTATLNSWNYAALVWDNQNVSVYLNTIAAPVYSAVRSFNAANGGDSLFFGTLSGGFDEARVASFGTGAFSTSMLNYQSVSAIPEPSTYAALIGVAALGLVAWRRRTHRR